MSREDLEEQLRRREAHTFCKTMLAEKRRKYKCAQNRIIALRNNNSWDVHIDPEGFVGVYGQCCCKWEAMIKALDDKFSEINDG